MQKPTKPYDNPLLVFEKSDFSYLDFEKDADVIIENVFLKGDVEDIRMCIRFYGDEKIAPILLKAESFDDRKRIYLAAAIFANDVKDYAAYSKSTVKS